MFEFETVAVVSLMVIGIICVILAIFSKTWRKILAGVFAFAAIIYGSFAARNALAEDALFDNYEIKRFIVVEPTETEEGPCLLITFAYHGKKLSWYEDKYLPQCKYEVLIFNGEEVIDSMVKLPRVLPLAR